MNNQLSGGVAVVTGAGRGFGRAIAEGLAAAGAAVTVTARTKEQLDDVAATIEARGGRALAVPGDVTSRDDVRRVNEETEAKFGPASIVIHNAGVPWPFGPIWHVDADEWWDAQAVHVRGAFLCMNTFVPTMLENGGGRVIIVTSTASQRVRPNLSGYAVAKHTQNRLVEHLAAEGQPHGVFSWAVHPGSAITEISHTTMGSPDAQRYLPDFIERLKHQQANEDPSLALNACATMCVKLASGNYDSLSGQYIQPDWDLDEMLAKTATA